MTTAHPLDCLPLPDGRIICLKYVESIKPPNSEDSLANKLKNDCCMEVTMTSGNVYTVSMLEIKKQEFCKDTSVEDLYSGVLSHWLRLNGHNWRV